MFRIHPAKYVIGKVSVPASGKGTQEFFIGMMFSNPVVHRDAMMLLKASAWDQYSNCVFSPHSAGFLTVDEGKIVTYGRSESLDLGGQEGDAEVLMHCLDPDHPLPACAPQRPAQV